MTLTIKAYREQQALQKISGHHRLEFPSRKIIGVKVGPQQAIASIKGEVCKRRERSRSLGRISEVSTGAFNSAEEFTQPQNLGSSE